MLAPDASKVREREVEDAWVGFRHADHVAVDDAAHRGVRPVTHLAHATAMQCLLDLTMGVADDADRHSGLVQSAQRGHALGDRPTPQEGVEARAQGTRGRAGVTLVHSDEPHVRRMMLGPKHLSRPRRTLDGHRVVVGANMEVDRGIATEVGEQRPQDGRVRQHQYPTGVEQDRIEVTHERNHARARRDPAVLARNQLASH